MSLIKQYGLLVASFVLALTGFFRIGNSVQKATELTAEYIRSVGGSLDTNTALLITEGYITTNIVIGGIMFFVGLVFFFYSMYAFCQK